MGKGEAAEKGGGRAAQRCNRPDCGRGPIDEQGFCAVCDRRPLERAPLPPAEHQAETQGVSIGVANVRPDPWYGLDLAEAGQLPEAVDTPTPEPTAIAEEYRFCDNAACGEPVGRGHDGAPGRVAGYCPHCGAPFDFAQPRGLTIAGRYDVERYLGAGAYGAAYLAHDRNLATDVVLKKLRNTSVASTVHHERTVLVGLRHDSIVRILGYETEGPHLVLEYLPGAPLTALPGDRLEFLLAHGVRILQALDYLHARGLLHCDVKPLNIIRFKEESSAGPRDRVRLIDFGAVRTRKDTGPVTAYTDVYAPPEHDPEHVRPTPGFDLYGLGVTLKEVSRLHLLERTAPGIDSLRLLLARATDTAVPQRRFVSARQFGEQLSGVIRQVVAAPPTLRQVTRPSALFGSMSESLHGGLGAARPLAHWFTAELTGDGALTLPPTFSSPAPATIAVALPTPLGDPDEPDIAESAESSLAEARLALRRDDADLAERALARATLPRWHWLHSWYSGLIALTRADAVAATAHFTEVRAALPGELIPQLALGLCAELRGDLAVARSHYGTVFDTTPALGAAGFGLARVHLLSGRRADAVATAERLSQEFRYEREARVAAVRLLVTVAAPEPGGNGDPGGAAAGDAVGPARPADPAEAELARAREALARLDVGTAAAAGLSAELQYAEYLRTGDRLALSETVRRLGPHAATARDYTALVDLANRLRPPLAWRWRGRERGRERGRRDGTADGNGQRVSESRPGR
ncbi:tetratricopeptide repeat protein [Streptomyces sp. NPDC088261]|uniref:tetratricopeptide repeat protein n=1 Tax=Streptomyces sp. NPDC088261 TaxID=3365851 RepID=UPI0037F1B80E